MTTTLCAACGATIYNKKDCVSLSDKVCMAMLYEVAAGAGRKESIYLSGYVYKKCKGKLHRLDTLKRQTHELQESIMATLPISMQMHLPKTGSQNTHAQVSTPQLPGSSSQGTPRGQKRALEEPSSKSHKRRRLYLRQIESHPTHTNSSTPAVAVSITYIIVAIIVLMVYIIIIVYGRLPSFTRVNRSLTS